MISYTRTCKVKDFIIYNESGTSATVSISAFVEIEGEKELHWFTETFDNIGDAPHIGETFEVEVQIFTNSNEDEMITVEPLW